MNANMMEIIILAFFLSLSDFHRNYYIYQIIQIAKSKFIACGRPYFLAQKVSKNIDGKNSFARP
jgi:hypothetical protein